MTREAVERLETRVWEAEDYSPVNAGREIYAPLEDLRSVLSRYRKMEGALGKIASCQTHHADDVVPVARQALGDSQ